jgi:hypothetical protein
MTDYRRGKTMVLTWSAHWDAIADIADSHTTVEEKLIEYGQPIRVAFTQAHVPELLMTAMPSYIRQTHYIIMGLPEDQREALMIWEFGDEGERIDFFGRKNREPYKIKAIYQKIGRRGSRTTLRK